MHEDTIVGIATGMGGGIGVIRISGRDAFTLVGKVFRTKKYIKEKNKTDNTEVYNTFSWDENYLAAKDSHTIHYGFIVDEREDILDEVIVLLMKSPNSYTKEDVIEIDSHGGAFILQKILYRLIHEGARLATPGEFTKRAFLNGRIDLSQAEAVMKLISSQNDFSHKSALEQLEGSVSKYIEQIRKSILHDLAYIEAALDDPEHISLDEFSEAFRKRLEDYISQLDKLLSNFDDGRMKSEGINTVIVGRPNAGKSSLMNLLLDQERAIVTDIAGTTRDIIEERVMLGNIILNLVDTAGIHDTDDVVESFGVDKAVSFLEKADLILYVIDGSEELNDDDFQIMERLQNKKGIVLLNKSDLDTCVMQNDIKSRLNWNILSFSNETKQGLADLKNFITDSFLKGDVSYNNQIYLTSVRHRDAVESAVLSLKRVLQTMDDGMPEDLYTIDLMEAYRELGLINGETASEDLVNKIFSDFCMGK